MNALLHQIAHSETAHALSLVLAHSLWQGVVVAAVLAVALRLMHGATARARYTAACLALLALVAWPVFTYVQVASDARFVVEAPWPDAALAAEPSEIRKPVSPARAVEVAPDIPVLRPSWEDSVRFTSYWQGWTLLLWLAGMTLLSAWHLCGWLGLQRLRHSSATPISGELASMAAQLARRMKLPRPARVCWSARVAGAVAFGWWKPVVLLPAAMAAGFSMRELEMILAHEFAHLRRHDYLMNLLQSAMETLLFYHPAMWWISHHIRREREHACDDIAVQATGDAMAYARALVLLAARASATSSPCPRLALAAGKRSGLRLRIERMLRPQAAEATSLPLRPIPGLAMLVLVILAIGIPDAARPLQAEEVSAIGPRGSIRDRNGVLLAVSDRQDRQIVFDLEKVVEAWRAAVPGREVPMKVYARSKDGEIAEDVLEPDIVFMFTDLVHPLLESNGLAQPWPANTMRVNYRERKRERPFVYTNDLTEETAKRAAALKGKIPGMDTRIVFLRHYPFKSMASHLLGYVISTGQIHQPGDKGVSGIEKSMESRLAPPSGNAGTLEKPDRGADVYLTLDVRHQYIVERALRDSQPAIGRGAVVLLDVNNGDVLAMASASSYDPNNFIPSISREKFKEYNNNTTNPLLNRSVRSFVPGATFKVATSLAAICDGKEAFQAKCEGGVTYGNHYMKCWIAQKGSVHGTLNLRAALKEDCGPYFYELGNAINNDKFDTTMALLGLGHDVATELPESDRGIYPGKAWWMKHRPREPFTAATIAIISIGQGAVQASPLQMASLMIPVANGGTVWRPRFVDRIVPSGDVSRQEKRPLQRAADLREHGLTNSGLETLRQALRETVKDGTATAANLPNLAIAGRTGTAQNWRMAEGVSLKDNHTAFIAYAPAENPKWAICVFVQGSLTGGRAAAPIAAHILAQVAEVEAGKRTVDPQPLEPIGGNFDPVDEVKFPLISK